MKKEIEQILEIGIYNSLGISTFIAGILFVIFSSASGDITLLSLSGILLILISVIILVIRDIKQKELLQ